MDIEGLAALWQLSPDNRARLLKQVQYFNFDHESQVIHKGQQIAGAVVVLKGQLRVFTYSSQGTEATLYMLRPGETCVLTLNCLFNNFRYPAWVQAEAQSAAVLIPGALYRELFQQQPSVQDITVQALSTLVFRLMESLEESQTCNLQQRITRYLLNHASAAGEVTITQQALASHLGSSREVVARLLQQMKAQGLLQTRRGVISISNETALLHLLTPLNGLSVE